MFQNKLRHHQYITGWTELLRYGKHALAADTKVVPHAVNQAHKHTSPCVLIDHEWGTEAANVICRSCQQIHVLGLVHAEGSATATARLSRLVLPPSHCLLTRNRVKCFVFDWPWLSAVKFYGPFRSLDQNVLPATICSRPLKDESPNQ